MTKLMLLLTLMAMAPATAPAAAQTAGPVLGRNPKPINAPGEISKSAPVNGVVVLYGNERCPTDGDGNEVVVCVRRSAQEQFRVPKELREFQVTPQNESWAKREVATTSTGVGVSSIGSCSVVGPGGQSGCFAQAARAAKAENRARTDAEARVP